MKNRKILIAEDDAFSRGAMEKILQSHNYETSSCVMAEEAVIKLQEGSFEILITDLRMQEMDGLELIREARKIHPEILTILVTGLASEEIKLKAKEERVNGFFPKPIQWDELIALLEVLTRTGKGKNQNIDRNIEKERYSSPYRGIFLTLILFLLTLFVIRILQAQEPFPKLNRPNLRMDSQGTCWKSLSPALTEEQMKALESLQRAYREEAAPKYRELMTLRLELQHYVLDKNINPQDMMKRHGKFLALQTELETLSFSYQMKARSILTREQLDRLPQDCLLEMGIGYGTGMGIGRGPRRGPRW